MGLFKSVKTTIIDIDGNPIPAKIYREFRNNVRASIGKKAAILRLPNHLSSTEQTKNLQWFESWVRKQFDKSENLKNQFFPTPYEDGDLLHVGDKTYVLRISTSDLKTHSAKLRENVINIRLTSKDSFFNAQKSIPTLLSRVIAKDFMPAIKARVLELNDRFFGSSINEVRLKNNQSNWGSCSSSGNINLSTRLLFAPNDVIDYVIIHELAHTKEMNHSKKFWNIVERIIPNYKEKEKWLKVNNHLCNF